MLHHIPVMGKEVLQSLNITENGIYVDGTFGDGGHSKLILKHLQNGHLYCFDKDQIALERGKQISLQQFKNFTLIHADFKDLKEELLKRSVTKVDGILLDLGVSTPQIGDKSRGFSYHQDGPLDMRMDQSQLFSAWNIINEWDEEKIASMMYNNADGKFVFKIAKAIVQNRPISSTQQLVDIVRKAIPAREARKKHPAKVLFQAMIMAVNNELEAIKNVISASETLLKKNGVLVIITFHSTEDRFVKQNFKKLIPTTLADLPIMVEPKFSFKQIRPSLEEIQNNKQARTAKLRILKKL